MCCALHQLNSGAGCAGFGLACGKPSSRSLQGLAEDLARWFFQQLIVALDFCHKKGIANRDIKLEVLPAAS